MLGGCQRCCPKPSQLCCDLHNPTAFVHLHVPPSKPSRQPARSAIPAYENNSKDDLLRVDIETWRCEEMKRMYGTAHLRNLGPALVMGTGVRDRIVDCAHFSKIMTVDDLERETKWGGSSKYGSAVISIIQRHYPPPLVPSQPAALPISSDPQATKTVRRPPTCSVCGMVGHRMRSALCPARQGKENVAPQVPIASTSTATLTASPYTQLLSQYSATLTTASDDAYTMQLLSQYPSALNAISYTSQPQYHPCLPSQYRLEDLPEFDVRNMCNEPLVFQSEELQELYNNIIQQRS